MTERLCRLCLAPLTFVACDLGEQPLANNLVALDEAERPDPRYALRLMVCDVCKLAQLGEAPDPDLMFAEYSYLSSVSSSWLAHVAAFAAAAVPRFGLGPHSLVLEIGSNDGAMLSSFLAQGIPCLGIEPAANVAAIARARGVATRTAYFGLDTARTLVGEGVRADLVICDNVLAHVPDLRGFVAGLAQALAPDGVLVIEVPHVLAMLREGQFDTIYHEHISYFSVHSLRNVLASVELAIFDIEKLATHGGSLRVMAQHAATGRHARTATLAAALTEEAAEGLGEVERYASLGRDAARIVTDLRNFLDEQRHEGHLVAAYGAAAKGTMLLNAARSSTMDLAFVADANTLKQGKLIPGCRIPIVSPEHLCKARPQKLLILPWNIADEIVAATSFIAEWGGACVVPLPRLHERTAPCA